MQVDDILKGITQENGITRDLMECHKHSSAVPYLCLTYHTAHKMKFVPKS